MVAESDELASLSTAKVSNLKTTGSKIVPSPPPASKKKFV